VDALTILTVSDQLVTGRSMTLLEREKSFKDMMVVALETAVA
jgi:purine-nucleoside phosphorylase